MEHCTDDQKQDGVMEEILRSACTLAQDQYGNYVVQVRLLSDMRFLIVFTMGCLIYIYIYIVPSGSTF